MFTSGEGARAGSCGPPAIRFASGGDHLRANVGLLAEAGARDLAGRRLGCATYLGEHLQKMMGTGMDRGMQYLWARDVRLGGNGDLAEVHLGGRVGVLRAGGRGWGGMPRVTHLPRCHWNQSIANAIRRKRWLDVHPVTRLLPPTPRPRPPAPPPRTPTAPPRLLGRWVFLSGFLYPPPCSLTCTVRWPGHPHASRFVFTPPPPRACSAVGFSALLAARDQAARGARSAAHGRRS